MKWIGKEPNEVELLNVSESDDRAEVEQLEDNKRAEFECNSGGKSQYPGLGYS
jgi:hypothetical protein